jgi:hypothetical protein
MAMISFIRSPARLGRHGALVNADRSTGRRPTGFMPRAKLVRQLQPFVLIDLFRPAAGVRLHAGPQPAYSIGIIACLRNYCAFRIYSRRKRINPSWATEATSRPSRENMLPRVNPRAPELLGLSCA